MKIVTSKREILGTLKTLVGTYSLLDDRVRKFNDLFRVEIIDDEGFEAWAQFIGDFIIVPAPFQIFADVKKVITDEEARELQLSDEELAITEFTQ
jgi:hypothetical protein